MFRGTATCETMSEVIHQKTMVQYKPVTKAKEVNKLMQTNAKHWLFIYSAEFI